MSCETNEPTSAMPWQELPPAGHAAPGVPGRAVVCARQPVLPGADRGDARGAARGSAHGVCGAQLRHERDAGAPSMAAKPVLSMPLVRLAAPRCSRRPLLLTRD